MGDMGAAGVEMSSQTGREDRNDVRETGLAQLDGHDREATQTDCLQSLAGVLAPKQDASQYSVLDRISPEELRAIVARATPGVPVIEDVYRIGTMRRWFVIYTNPRCETKVQETCKKIGFDTYFPQGTEARRQTRREIQQKKPIEAIQRPVMTRYLFIQLPVDPYNSITPFGFVKNISGVGGFVGTSDGPLVLSAAIIASIREREAAGEFNLIKRVGDTDAIVPKWVEIGKGVRVNDGGPFSGFMGLIEAILPNSIIKVGVNIFGRSTPVELELAKVAQIS